MAINTAFCKIGYLSFHQFINIFGDQIFEINQSGKEEKISNVVC
jgi:hypothetical protein